MQNLVVVGFGFMGMTHAMSILNHSGAQLVAIVDLDLGKQGGKLINHISSL